MVFSNKNVVRVINAHFVPIALKAAMVNNPPRGPEGKIYAEINRTKAAPQGIAVMNSDGKVLDWVLSFDDDESIEKFFEHVRDRYQKFPDSDERISTERYRSFPSRKMGDVADSGKRLVIPEKHGRDRCPANPKVDAAMLIGKVVGRPLDSEGQPIKKTLHQEDYMEATFDISKHAQQELIAAIANSKSGRFKIPDSLVREIVGPAYLGQLDVSPLDRVPTGSNTDQWWEFSAETVDSDSSRLRLVGRSHVAGTGNQWNHRVSLDWQGYIEIKKDLINRIDLLASGYEHLRWHTANLSLLNQPASATLMGGHPIDLDAKVKYGFKAKR